MAKKYRTDYPRYFGIYGVEYIPGGMYSDSHIRYRKYIFNEWCVSSCLWHEFLEDNPRFTDKDAWTEPAETEFAAFMKSNLVPFLQDCIFGGGYDYRIK